MGPKAPGKGPRASHACSHCKKKFGEKRYLDRHAPKCLDRQSRQQDNMASRTCSMCGKVFPFLSRLQRHQLTVHGGAKDRSCPDCGAAFAEASHLRRHRQRRHPHTAEAEPNVFACVHCAADFASQWELERHRSRLHAIQKTCELCYPKVVFGENKAWKSHQEYHKGKRSFLCGECLMAFKQGCELRNHRNARHAPTDLFVCRICRVSFAQQTQVTRHFLAAHPKGEAAAETLPLLCKFCEHSFALSTELSDHVSATHFHRVNAAELEKEKASSELEIRLEVRISADVGESFELLRIDEKLPPALLRSFPCLQQFEVRSPEAVFSPGQRLRLRLLLPKSNQVCEDFQYSSDPIIITIP